MTGNEFGFQYLYSFSSMVAYFSTHAISKGNRDIKNSDEAFPKESEFHHIYLINPIFLH
jgi:hypothetical protein